MKKEIEELKAKLKKYEEVEEKPACDNKEDESPMFEPDENAAEQEENENQQQAEDLTETPGEVNKDDEESSPLKACDEEMIRAKIQDERDLE